jgi:hypothetical protein
MPPSSQWQRKPTAEVQQLTPFRGLVTKGLSVVASAPALLLADVGFRGCDGIISAVGRSKDRCWNTSWSPSRVQFVRFLSKYHLVRFDGV